MAKVKGRTPNGIIMVAAKKKKKKKKNHPRGREITSFIHKMRNTGKVVKSRKKGKRKTPPPPQLRTPVYPRAAQLSSPAWQRFRTRPKGVSGTGMLDKKKVHNEMAFRVIPKM
jgi:hypothetical protein